MAFEPSEVQAEVERLIADQESAEVSLRWLEAEASAIVDRHRAARAERAEREREAARKEVEVAAKEVSNAFRRASLLRHGESYARELTSDREQWDFSEASDACAAACEELRSVIRPEWTERQVERVVDDILSDWE